MSVYVFETIDVIGAGRGALVERIRSSWAPHLEDEFGIRLVGVWATVGSTGAWPEANALWASDDWESFGHSQASRFPLEEKDPYGCELTRHSWRLRARTRYDLLVGTAFSPSGEDARPSDAGAVVLRENVRSRPGRLSAYHDALAAEWLPRATARGISLLGAWGHALRPNVGMNLWSFRDWSHVCDTMEGMDRDPDRAAWHEREQELLEDVHGWLLAVPPAGTLGT